MNIQELATIIIPILGFMGWVYGRIEKKAESRHLEIKTEIKEMRTSIQSLDSRIQSLDSRVSRIEGHLIGMHHWEPKIIQKEDQK